MINKEKIDELFNKEEVINNIIDDFWMTKDILGKSYEYDFSRVLKQCRQEILALLRQADDNVAEKIWSLVNEAVSEIDCRALYEGMIGEIGMPMTHSEEEYKVNIVAKLLVYIYAQNIEDNTYLNSGVECIDYKVKYSALYDVIVWMFTTDSRLESVVESVFLPYTNEQSLDRCVSLGMYDALLRKFQMAVYVKNTRMLYKIANAISSIEPGEGKYYEGIADICLGYYEAASECFERIDSNSRIMPKVVEAKLELYSAAGEVAPFFSLLSKHKDSVSAEYACYYAQLMMRNAEEGAWEIDSDFINDLHICGNKKFVELAAKEMYFAYIDICNTFDTVRDLGRMYLQEIDAGKEDNSKIEKICMEKDHNLMIYNNIISFGCAILCEENVAKNITIRDFVKELQNDWDGFVLPKDVASKIEEKYLISNEVKTEGDAIFALNSLYNLGQFDEFYKYVCRYFENLKNIAKSQSHHAMDAYNILINAYSVGTTEGCDDSNLNDFYETYVSADFNEMITEWGEDKSNKSATTSTNTYGGKYVIGYDQIKTYEKIRNIGSEKAWKLFVAAEWMYIESLKCDYGNMDAGMLVLGFSRIVELYINEKFFSRIRKNEGNKIAKKYEKCKKYMEENERDNYERTWGEVQKTLKDKRDNNVMLGPALYFFRNLRLEDDKLSEYIVNDILKKKDENDKNKYLTEEGIKNICEANIETINSKGETIKISAMEDLISNEKRERYRNPPAHCTYTEYELVSECRDYTCDALEKMSTWFEYEV